MEKHKVVLLSETKLEEFYQEIMYDESLALVRHAVAHRYRKGVPIRFSLQSKGVDLFKLEDPAKGGTWLFFWNEAEEPRRVLIGKRRLNRIIGRFGGLMTPAKQSKWRMRMSSPKQSPRSKE